MPQKAEPSAGVGRGLVGAKFFEQEKREPSSPDCCQIASLTPEAQACAPDGAGAAIVVDPSIERQPTTSPDALRRHGFYYEAIIALNGAGDGR
jgi:hypothetical protein